MNGILVDSNVILDIFEDDPVWYSWSEAQLEHYGALGALYINPIIDLLQKSSRGVQTSVCQTFAVAAEWANSSVHS